MPNRTIPDWKPFLILIVLLIIHVNVLAGAIHWMWPSFWPTAGSFVTLAWDSVAPTTSPQPDVPVNPVPSEPAPEQPEYVPPAQVPVESAPASTKPIVLPPEQRPD